MGFFKKVAEDIFPPDEPMDEVEEEVVETKKGNSSAKTTVSPLSSNTSNKIVCVEPRAYSESQQIADHLKKKNSVVVNLKRVTADQAKRIIDFLSGTLYAIGGDLHKLGNGIYLCTPKNVDVEGRMSDEESDKKSKAKIEDEMDF